MGRNTRRGITEGGALTPGGRGSCVASIIVATTAAAILTEKADWDVALLVVLLAMTLAAEVSSVEIGGITFAGSDVSTALAIVLLGPLPAIAITGAGLLLDARRRRISADHLLLNSAIFAVFVLTGATAFEAASAADLTSPGGASLLLVTIGVVAINNVVNFLLTVWTSPRLAGVPLHSVIRETFGPLLPWVVMSAALTAGAVHAYFDFGIGVIVSLLLMQAVVHVLLFSVERAGRREKDYVAMVQERDRFMRESLEAGDRERRRVAMDLHDDALQTLLAARQDVASAIAGSPHRLPYAADRLAKGIDQLRDLVTSRFVDRSDTSLLGAQLDLLLDHAGEQGLSWTLELDPDLEDYPEPIILPVVAELVVNVVKHASATSVDVRIYREQGAIVIEVIDDGVGVDSAMVARRRSEGHVGLALVRERLRAVAGALELSGGTGAGTRARAVIPA